MPTWNVRHKGLEVAVLQELDEGQRLSFGVKTEEDKINFINKYQPLHAEVVERRPPSERAGTREHKHRVLCVVQDLLNVIGSSRDKAATDGACKERLHAHVRELCELLPTEVEEEEADSFYVRCAAFAVLCCLSMDVPPEVRLFGGGGGEDSDPAGRPSLLETLCRVVGPLSDGLVVFLPPAADAAPLGQMGKVPSRGAGGATGEGCFIVNSWAHVFRLAATGYDAPLVSQSDHRATKKQKTAAGGGGGGGDTADRGADSRPKVHVVLVRFGEKEEYEHPWFADGRCACPFAKASLEAPEFVCREPSSGLRRLLELLQFEVVYTKKANGTATAWAHRVADLASLAHGGGEVYAVLQHKTPYDPATGIAYYAPSSQCVDPRGDKKEQEETLHCELQDAIDKVAAAGAMHGKIL